MGTLLLNSLEIRNFRGFHHLQIERLGRVNLIVGKNNVGKSSLLEALQLYAYRGLPDLIWDILGTRDELRVSLHVAGIEDLLSALKYLVGIVLRASKKQPKKISRKTACLSDYH